MPPPTTSTVGSSSLAALLLAVACASCAAAADPGAWTTYRNESVGYALDHPAGWEVFEARSGSNETPRGAGPVLSPGVLQQVVFREPDGKIWPGEFVVTVREHPGDVELEAWADATFLDVFDDSLVTRAEDTTLAGRPAKLFHVFGFDQTEFVVALHERGRIYTLSFTGSTPNDPDLAAHQAIYRTMRTSFRLEAPDREADGRQGPGG